MRLRQAERVVGAQRAGLQRRDRVLEVIDRACGAGEVQDVVDACPSPSAGWRCRGRLKRNRGLAAEVVEVRADRRSMMLSTAMTFMSFNFKKAFAAVKDQAESG